MIYLNICTSIHTTWGQTLDFVFKGLEYLPHVPQIVYDNNNNIYSYNFKPRARAWDVLSGLPRPQPKNEWKREIEESKENMAP